MECLKLLVVESPHCIVAKRIVDEICTLEQKRNNKVEHADGEHDDTVIAKALARYVVDHLFRDLRRVARVDAARVQQRMKSLSLQNRSDAPRLAPPGVLRDALQNAQDRARLEDAKRARGASRILMYNSKDKQILDAVLGEEVARRPPDVVDYMKRYQKEPTNAER